MDNKQELRNKLRQKIQQKQKKRQGNKKNIKKEQIKSHNIYKNVKTLMEDVAILKQKMGKKFVHAQVGKLLRTKYSWLYDNYFPIYRATVFEEMDLNMLKMMLNEKNLIDTNVSTNDESDKKIGSFLGDKYNIDMEKLEKDLKEKYGEQ